MVSALSALALLKPAGTSSRSDRMPPGAISWLGLSVARHSCSSFGVSPRWETEWRARAAEPAPLVPAVPALALLRPAGPSSRSDRMPPGAISWLGLSVARHSCSSFGVSPRWETEWRATDNPNHEIAPGGMRSDREEVPAGFSKANADKAETMEAALAGGDSEMRTLAAPDCQVYWPAPYEAIGRAAWRGRGEERAGG